MIETGAMMYLFIGFVISALAVVIPPLSYIIAGIALLAMLIIQTLELAVCYYVSPEEVKKGYSWNSKIVGKVLLLSLIVVAAIMDVALYTAAHFLPQEHALLGHGFLFFTVTTIIWLTAADAARIVNHVGIHQGAENIPPTIMLAVGQIRWVITQLKRIDVARWKASGHDGKPPSRWMDNLSDDEVATIVAMVERRKKPAPAHPKKILREVKENND